MNERNTWLGILSISFVKVAFLSLSRLNKLKQFIKVGYINSIYLFPLKSGAPLSLQSAKCSRTGLVHDGITDRHWMVIRKDGSFLSARLEPKLVLIRPSVDGRNLYLDAPGMPTLILPKSPHINNISRMVKCRVWDDFIIGLHCGLEAERWIQKYLGYKGPSIVVSTENMDKRDCSLVEKPWGNPATEGDLAAFADFSAYMVMSEPSLQDLNSRLNKSVAMTRFRPNITVAGCQPFEEETWSEIRIGNHVYIRILDLCSRCVLTTVDPSKGEKDPKRQPLETLKSYRYVKEYDAACFGVNAALDIEGDINVGDPVYALKK